MKHIRYNPTGDVNLKIKIDLLNPESLTTDQKELANAFLDGANFLYQATISDSTDSFFVTGTSIICDNSTLETEGIYIDYLSEDDLPEGAVPYSTLPTLKQKDAEIVFENSEYDPETQEYIITQIINPIPVRITPVLNGVDVTGESESIPKIETIAEVDQLNVLFYSKHLKTKEASELPSYRTSAFSVLDGDKKIEGVFFNIYVIKGEPQNLESLMLLEEEAENYGKMIGIKLDDFNINVSYINILDKCMNFVGNIDLLSEPKTFDYLQLRLFDSEGNDLSLNNKEYQIDFSNAMVVEGSKVISLGISAIN
jgi:hypothetical protein